MSAPGSHNRKHNGLQSAISKQNRNNWKYNRIIHRSITILIKYHTRDKDPRTDNNNRNRKLKSSKLMSPKCHKNIVNHSNTKLNKKSVNKSILINVQCVTSYWCHQPTNLLFCFRVDIPSVSSVSISMLRKRNSAPTVDNQLIQWRQTSNSRTW